MDELTEKGGVELEMTLFHIKCTKGPEKLGLWKKSEVIKTSLDLITFTDEDLKDIGDTMLDAIAELLQQFE